MNRPLCLGCLAVVMLVPRVTLAQRAPSRTAPPAAVRPAKPEAAKLPPGAKPPTLETAQKETQRLREAIEKVERRIAAKEAEKAKDAAAHEKAAATGKASPPAGSAEKRTPAGVEMENKLLRRKLDKLLVRAAELEGTIPARPPGSPAYDPHVIDSPTNANFCPGHKLAELEDTMRFSGTLVAEKGDELFYEWTIHTTNAARSHHATHRLWAQMKDGVSVAVMEAEPGVRKDGPPPSALP
jgi:hypothetical protein